MRDKGDLELGEDPIPWIKEVNFLRRIGNKTIAYDNDLPPRKQTFLSDEQVRYVKYIVVSRDTANNGMGRKEAMQVI